MTFVKSRKHKQQIYFWSSLLDEKYTRNHFVLILIVVMQIVYLLFDYIEELKHQKAYGITGTIFLLSLGLLVLVIGINQYLHEMKFKKETMFEITSGSICTLLGSLILGQKISSSRIS